MSGLCYVVYRWNYSLQFNANGGSGAPSSKTFLSGTSTTIPSTKPTRTGYTFDGWYTSSSGGSKVSTSTKMDSTSGKTIYAHWTVNTYSIVYDANGGSGSMSNQSMTYDKASNLTTNTYTRQGLIIGNVATNAKVTVSDCFGNSSASANFYNGTATVSNSLYNVGGTKKY